MKIVFYSKDVQFELTDEEFKSFVEKANDGKKVFVPRLNVLLSSMFIWAGEKPDSEKTSKKEITTFFDQFRKLN